MCKISLVLHGFVYKLFFSVAQVVIELTATNVINEIAVPLICCQVNLIFGKLDGE